MVQSTIQALREINLGDLNIAGRDHIQTIDLNREGPIHSRLGTNITYEWLGIAKLSEVNFRQVPSTFQISGDLLAKVDDAWNAAIERGEKRFDGAQLRFEGVEQEIGGSKLIVSASPTSYRLHNILRLPDTYIESGLAVPSDRFAYPSPLTINTVQVTTDGKILLGLKNAVISDQTDIGLLGAGFIGRRRTDGAGNFTPFNPNKLEDVVRKECEGETNYQSEEPFDLADARVLAIVNGSNTDTTLTIYLPLKIHSSMVGIGNNEHKELILLDDDDLSILEMVQRTELTTTGDRFQLGDHAIGSIEAYMLARDAGLIEHPYRLG